MPEKLRWGLLSTARINRALIPPIRQSARSELIAVASRDQARAENYARTWDIPRAYGSYQALLEDPDIDVVYISLPNKMHGEWTIRAAQADKHVLCEKPLVPTLEELDDVEATACQHHVTVFEAFMYSARSSPAHPKLVQLLPIPRAGKQHSPISRTCRRLTVGCRRLPQQHGHYPGRCTASGGLGAPDHRRDWRRGHAHRADAFQQCAGRTDLLQFPYAFPTGDRHRRRGCIPDHPRTVETWQRWPPHQDLGAASKRRDQGTGDTPSGSLFVRGPGHGGLRARRSRAGRPAAAQSGLPSQRAGPLSLSTYRSAGRAPELHPTICGRWYRVTRTQTSALFLVLS